jgi:hypothetical protein
MEPDLSLFLGELASSSKLCKNISNIKVYWEI